MINDDVYIGNELELFAQAKNWKSYWGKQVMPYIGAKVLEVGAGIGTNTKYLLGQNPHVKQWICVEPDQVLSKQIESNVEGEYLPKIRVESCYLKDLKTSIKFDSILYIDVIEHIEDDSAEIEFAKSLLNENGHLIILVPAHQYLYSDFDKAIGHYRRYNKKMLNAVVGEDLYLAKLIYMDSVGMAASTVNKLFLKQSYPTLKQIKFWDHFLISASRVSDSVLRYKIGKTLIGVWKK